MVYWFVYVAGDGGAAVKIGLSVNPKNRAYTLSHEAGCKIKIHKRWGLPYEAARKLEHVAHYVLRSCRADGEWFNCDSGTAIHAISGIITKTDKGRDWSSYLDALKAKCRSRQIGARASTNARVKRVRERAEIIRERWMANPYIYSTSELVREAGVCRNSLIKHLGTRMYMSHAAEELKEAKLPYNTASAHLGKRPTAQRNHRAALKRKAAA